MMAQIRKKKIPTPTRFVPLHDFEETTASEEKQYIRDRMAN